MAEKYSTSPLMQASRSHYQAQRDKCLAELDVYLNRSSGVGDHASVVDDVIKLFAQLDSAESVLATIDGIIQANQPSTMRTIMDASVPESNEQKTTD